MWWLSISEINSSVSSSRKKLSYRKHVHHNPSIKYASTDVERRESGSMFCETKHFLKFERIEQKAWKHSAEKYHDQTMKFTPPVVGLTRFYLWVCSHHTSALGNWILRCLTGSHPIFIIWFWSSKSNHRVRLTVNMNIADSISFDSILGKVITSFWG